MRKRHGVIGAVVTALLWGVLAAGAGHAKTLPSPPQCVSSSAAVAPHAGGIVLTRQPKGGPVACGERTAFPGKETRIGVAASGAVVTMADFPTGFEGTSFAKPAFPGNDNANTQLSPGGVAVRPTGGTAWQGVQPLGRDWAGQDWQ